MHPDPAWLRILQELGATEHDMPDPLAGPWGRTDSWVLDAAAGSPVVLKCWNASNFAACRAEWTALIHTRHRPLTPDPLPLLGSYAPVRLASGSWVTAREYLPGPTLEQSSRFKFADLGGALAELHDGLSGVQRLGRSRLHSVRQASAEHGIPDLRKSLRWAHAILEPWWSDLLRLRHATVHGDATWSNIIADPLNRIAPLRFIDFEFCRFDLRVFDLVAALGGARSEADGSFIPAAPGDVYQIASAYSTASTLDDIEIDLLPLASLAFFVMIAHDLSLRGAHSSYNLGAVLEIACQWVVDSGLHV